VIPDPPSEVELKEGLLQSLTIFLNDTSLAHAVGENGSLSCQVEVHLEQGRGLWAKGGASFVRRIDMKKR
jgi:hypothetical protein